MFFVISFLLLFVVLAVKRLDWAVMLIVAGLPLYLVRFNVLGVPVTLLEAMILIAFFVWFISRTHFKDFIRGRYSVKDFLQNSPFSKGGSYEGRVLYPFGIEIILLLVISLVSVGVSKFSLDALGIWKAYFLEPALLYILILNVFGRRVDGVYRIIFSLAMGVLSVSAYAIWQNITGLGIANPLWAAAATRRVVSFFGYPNAVGLYLAPIVMMLISFLFIPSKKELSKQEEKVFFPLKKKDISELGLSKGFLLLIIVCSLLSVYFAHSEGAIIGLLTAFFIFGILGNKKMRWTVLIGSVLCVSLLFIIPGVGKKVLEKATLKDFSGQVRQAQWRETWKMLKEDGRWLTGAGLANYQKAIESYHVPGIFYNDGTDPDFRLHVVFNDEYKKKVWRPVEIYLYPHNIALNFWSELGLAGALLFFWIFAKLLIINYKLLIKDKNNKFLYLGILGALVVIIVHGLVDVPYFKNDLSCLFWILVAILVLLDLKCENKKN
jgi:O-antigen ligase